MRVAISTQGVGSTSLSPLSRRGVGVDDARGVNPSEVRSDQLRRDSDQLLPTRGVLDETHRQTALARLGAGTRLASSVRVTAEQAAESLSGLLGGSGTTDELLDVARQLHELTLAGLPAGQPNAKPVPSSVFLNTVDPFAAIDALRGGLNFTAVALLDPQGPTVTDEDIERGIDTLTRVIERIDTIRENLQAQAGGLDAAIDTPESARDAVDLVTGAFSRLRDAHTNASPAAVLLAIA